MVDGCAIGTLRLRVNLVALYRSETSLEKLVSVCPSWESHDNARYSQECEVSHHEASKTISSTSDQQISSMRCHCVGGAFKSGPGYHGQRLTALTLG